MLVLLVSIAAVALLFRLVAGARQRRSVQGPDLLRWLVPAGVGSARPRSTGWRSACSLIRLVCSRIAARRQEKAHVCSDVAFPCVGECTQDFAQSCPSGWSLDGSGSYVAPASYAGKCVTKKSFTAFGQRMFMPLACALVLRSSFAVAGIADRSAWASFCEVQVWLCYAFGLQASVLGFMLCLDFAVAVPSKPFASGA